MDIKYPTVEVALSGQDGNIFFIIGRVRRALERHGVPQEEITKFTEEVQATKSYDEALQKIMSWVNVS